MSLAIWCEVVCNGCAKPAEGMFTYSILPRKKLKKSAKVQGFVIIGDEAYCSVCAIKRVKMRETADA